MDRSEGERRAAVRPKDQPETEGSRASRRARSVTEEKRGGQAHRENKTERRQKTGARSARHFCGAAGLFDRPCAQPAA